MTFRTVAFAVVLMGCLVWPLDGARLVPGGADPRPERLYTLDGGGSPTDTIAFSPAGSLLATGSEDHATKTWDLATGRLRRTLGSPGLAVGSVAFSPDRRVLAAGSSDASVKLWDVGSGRLERTLSGVFGPVSFSPDGRLLAAVGENWVRLWETRSWKVVTTLAGAPLPPSPANTSIAISQIAFAPDGKSLAVVESVFSPGDPPSPDGFVVLWDRTTRKVRCSLHEPLASQIQVAFSPDSLQLAVAGGWINRGDVLLWDLRSGKTRPLFSLDDIDTVSSIVYDPHGRWVGFATQAGARFVDVALAKQFMTLDVARSAFGPKQVYALSPYGRLLAAIREDGAVEVWRLPADLDAVGPAAASGRATNHAGAPR